MPVIRKTLFVKFYHSITCVALPQILSYFTPTLIRLTSKFIRNKKNSVISGTKLDIIAKSLDSGRYYKS